MFIFFCIFFSNFHTLIFFLTFSSSALHAVIIYTSFWFEVLNNAGRQHHGVTTILFLSFFVLLVLGMQSKVLCMLVNSFTTEMHILPYFGFWDRFLLSCLCWPCSPGWSWTLNSPPVSASLKIFTTILWKSSLYIRRSDDNLLHCCLIVGNVIFFSYTVIVYIKFLI